MIKIKELQEDIIDEVGGLHSNGVGWNPSGVWCGECSFRTCKGCVNENLKNDKQSEKQDFTGWKKVRKFNPKT
jgi:uncharacterized ferredoxin-like protein